MQANRRLLLLLVVFILAVSGLVSVAQVVTATLQVGNSPIGVAVNPVTNKIYTANQNDYPTGTVTVIDGATNNTQSINIGGYEPYGLALNSVTNKIYVVNYCASSNNCNNGSFTVIDGATNNSATYSLAGSPTGTVAVNSKTNKIYMVIYGYPGSVTVVDGATNNTKTVTVGNYPTAIAVNSVTNKIYVTNDGDYPGTVTVIDGATNGTQTVKVDYYPYSLAVNSVTNKIYVAHINYSGTVTVIDGATNNTATVNAGYYPVGIGLNSVTNKIYVVDECAEPGYCYTGTLTVIDGATNHPLTVGGVPSFYYAGVAVDSVTNKIYAVGEPEYSNAIAVIDGTTNTITTVGVGYVNYNAKVPVAVNEATDRIYVSNTGDNTVSVITGDTTLHFVPVTPCRVVDTRSANGTFGGPPIQGGNYRDFPIPQGSCNIPANAIAYALNVTVVPSGPLGYLTIWPTSQYQPSTSTMNSPDGRVKANAAIVQGGVNAAVSVYVSDTTNVILDIDGYFATASNSTLAFFSLQPCRVIDTRKATGSLGGPFLSGGQQRNFPVLDASSCGIPSNAQAYSFNFTVVPHKKLGYLTVWPTGQSQPQVSTLNAPTGTIVANAAIVPAGTGGQIRTYVTDDTELIADINGYFAPAKSGANPLSLYPLQACRMLDTRFGQGGWFSGQYVLDVVDNSCAASNQAQSYVLNATVIPRVSLGYLTVWPDGGTMPVVSTLNAVDGAIASNMAIVPTTNGLIDVYSSNLTQLLLDISGYFAP
jgi:DNA-binding beta-propeller fold protein YncE